MATDYDAPRQKETDDVVDESLEQLAGRRNDAATAVLDVDDGDELEDFEPPAGQARWRSDDLRRLRLTMHVTEDDLPEPRNR
jgi:hypothetical protein